MLVQRYARSATGSGKGKPEESGKATGWTCRIKEAVSVTAAMVPQIFGRAIECSLGRSAKAHLDVTHRSIGREDDADPSLPSLSPVYLQLRSYSLLASIRFP